MIRAALYERVSTQEQAHHGLSLSAQQSALEEYCQSHDIKIVGHYTDEGISGGKPANKRPAMSRLLDDIKADKVDLVLFIKLDRWFRNVPEYYKTQDILEAHHCGWKAILQDYDTTTANGRMVIGIMLSIAQQERERTSERIKFVYEQKAKQGVCMFGGKSTPLGYKIEVIDGARRLVKDPATRQAVEAFWRVMIATHNMQAGRRELLKYGIKKSRYGIDHITHNCTTYYGEYMGNTAYCEPYVTKQEYMSTHKNLVKVIKDRYYLFTGLIYCPVCHHRMESCYQLQPRKDGSKGEFYGLRCPLSSSNAGCTYKTYLSERKVEKQMLEKLGAYLDDYALSVEITQKKRKPAQQQDIDALKQKLRRLNVVYMDGYMADDEYKAQARKINDAIQAAKAVQEQPEKTADEIRATLPDNWRTLYNDMTRQEKQQFWRGVVREIKLEGRDVVGILF